MAHDTDTTLRFHDHGPNGATYVMVYGPNDMAEVFTNEQIDHLANGEMIIKGRSSIVDLEAFFVANNRFGVAA